MYVSAQACTVWVLSPAGALLSVFTTVTACSNDGGNVSPTVDKYLNVFLWTSSAYLTAFDKAGLTKWYYAPGYKNTYPTAVTVDSSDMIFASVSGTGGNAFGVCNVSTGVVTMFATLAYPITAPLALTADRCLYVTYLAGGSSRLERGCQIPKPPRPPTDPSFAPSFAPSIAPLFAPSSLPTNEPTTAPVKDTAVRTVAPTNEPS